MTKRTKRLVLSSILGVFLVSSYQNCAKGGFETIVPEARDFASLPGPGGGGTARELGFILPIENAGQRFSSFDECQDNDSIVDACIFLKNPLYSKGSPFSSTLRHQSDLKSIQNFGVKLEGLNGTGRLESTEGLVVYYTGDNLDRSFYGNKNYFQLDLVNGKKFQSYQNDGPSSSISDNEKNTVQLMAYFWIQHLGLELVRRTNINWTYARPIYVDAYATDARYGGAEVQNAFYMPHFVGNQVTSHEVVMGYATDSGGNNAHEMALSAEVYVHEMGHANLSQAAGASLYGNEDNAQFEIIVRICTATPSAVGNHYLLTNAGINSLGSQCMTNGGDFDYSIRAAFCKTKFGCIDALNEGQADFHYLMMFPNATALGETITNTTQGFTSSPIYLPGTPGGSQCGAVDTSKPSVSRDVNAEPPGAGTAQNYFDGSSVQYPVDSPSGMIRCGQNVPGEIHGMGSLYAKILWDIYSRTSNKRQFEKTFQNTLWMHTYSATLTTARGFLLADDMATQGGVNQAIINQVFDEKGIP